MPIMNLPGRKSDLVISMDSIEKIISAITLKPRKTARDYSNATMIPLYIVNGALAGYAPLTAMAAKGLVAMEPSTTRKPDWFNNLTTAQKKLVPLAVTKFIKTPNMRGITFDMDISSDRSSIFSLTDTLLNKSNMHPAKREGCRKAIAENVNNQSEGFQKTRADLESLQVMINSMTNQITAMASVGVRSLQIAPAVPVAVAVAVAAPVAAATV